MLLENFTSFDDFLSDGIIAVLNNTFGMTGSGVLFCHLRDWYGVDCSVKPLDLSAFEVSIVDLLGSGGEMVLRNLVRFLSKSIDVELNDWGRGFRDNILYLRNYFKDS